MGGRPVGLYFSAKAGARPAQGAPVPGWSAYQQDGFPVPPPGEPGKVTLERATQAGFKRKREVSTPYFLGTCYVPGTFSQGIVASRFLRF